MSRARGRSWTSCPGLALCSARGTTLAVGGQKGACCHGARTRVKFEGNTTVDDLRRIFAEAVKEARSRGKFMQSLLNTLAFAKDELHEAVEVLVKQGALMDHNPMWLSTLYGRELCAQLLMARDFDDKD